MKVFAKKNIVKHIDKWTFQRETTSIEEADDYCIVHCDYGSFKLNFRFTFNKEKCN